MTGHFARRRGQGGQASRRSGSNLPSREGRRVAGARRLALEALEARHVLTSLADVVNLETVFEFNPPAYGGVAAAPSDPHFAQQWDLDQHHVPVSDIDAREAWGWTSGSTASRCG